MARVGLSITKSTSFRNATQEFSNVYYFDGGVTLPSIADANSLIDAVKAAEVGFHSTAVTFVRGRCWSQGGSPASNNMISQKNLSGTGSTTLITSFDKERAFLFRWRAGQDSRGQPVYLRKWYHSCGNGPANTPASSAILENTSGFSGANMTAMASAVNAVEQFIIGGVPYTLISKAGRSVDVGQDAVSHPYLEHHQLGDMWRAQ